MTSYPRKRFYTLDIARALAIILVAIGHFDVEPMPVFYKNLHDIIYTFHMPLFMFVSGFLAMTTMRSVSYAEFIKKKFYRLIVPYFVVSIIILIIKLLSESKLNVDHPVVPLDFIEIIWLPKAGAFLWFIFALWWLMVLIPIFNTPKKRLLLLIIAIPLHFCSGMVTEYFCFDKMAYFAIYFASGTIMSDILRKIPIKQICLVSFFTFPVLTGIIVSENIEIFGLSNVLSSIFYLITAFSGIGSSITISNAIERYGHNKIKKVLFSISGASYIIYLFHTTFMGFAKSILVKFKFFTTGNLFEHYTIAEFIVPILFGVVIPYFIFKFLDRYKITQKIFGLYRWK